MLDCGCPGPALGTQALYSSGHTWSTDMLVTLGQPFCLLRPWCSHLDSEGSDTLQVARTSYETMAVKGHQQTTQFRTNGGVISQVVGYFLVSLLFVSQFPFLPVRPSEIN